MCRCLKTRSTTVGQNMHKRLNADEKCRSEEEGNSEFTVPEPSAWKRHATYLLLLLWRWKAASPVSAHYGVMQCPCISYFSLVLLLLQVLNGWFYIQGYIFVDEITSTLAYLIPLKAGRRSFLLTKAVRQTPAGVVKSRLRLQVTAFDLEESESECKAFVICWLYFLVVVFQTAICWMYSDEACVIPVFSPATCAVNLTVWPPNHKKHLEIEKSQVSCC